MLKHESTVGTQVWTLLGTAKVALLIQAFGMLDIYIGSVAPTAASGYIRPESGDALLLKDLNLFGGGVWVRFAQVGGGSASYVTA